MPERTKLGEGEIGAWKVFRVKGSGVSQDRKFLSFRKVGHPDFLRRKSNHAPERSRQGRFCPSRTTCREFSSSPFWRFSASALPRRKKSMRAAFPDTWRRVFRRFRKRTECRQRNSDSICNTWRSSRIRRADRGAIGKWRITPRPRGISPFRIERVSVTFPFRTKTFSNAFKPHVPK